MWGRPPSWTWSPLDDAVCHARRAMRPESRSPISTTASWEHPSTAPRLCAVQFSQLRYYPRSIHLGFFGSSPFIIRRVAPKKWFIGESRNRKCILDVILLYWSRAGKSENRIRRVTGGGVVRPPGRRLGAADRAPRRRVRGHRVTLCLWPVQADFCFFNISRTRARATRCRGRRGSTHPRGTAR